MAYCERCGRGFPHNRARQHEEDSPNHYICRPCDKDFTTWLGLKEHFVQSPNHSYCRLCDTHFDSDDDLEDHEYEDHYPCGSCKKLFSTDTGLHEHNRQRHWYCPACRRLFQSENNLNAHLNSSHHKPKSVYCPGANCGRAFVSASALMLHFEAGTCPSGLTREELNRLVIRMDRNNVITNPARLIKGPEGYTPATVAKTWATERSWNGDAYECFLCHKLFRTLRSLNVHLQSPRHEEKVYRCPNRTSCSVEFRALSSLTQHVESDKCGVNRFKDVRDAMDSLVSSMRLLSYDP